MDDPSVWEALVIHDPSMVQARDHKPAGKGKNKSRGRCEALKSMFKPGKGGKGRQGGATPSNSPRDAPKDRLDHRRFY